MDSSSLTVAGWNQGASPSPRGLGASPSAEAALERSQRFDDVLGRARRSGGTAKAREQEARDAAEQLIAVSFVQPMLKAAREARAQGGPFGLTQGERQIGQLMDAELARQIVRSARWPLVDRLTNDLTRRGEAAPSTPMIGGASA
ncbi:MAG: hypothetical protein SFZ23_00895 [Planctomycetota bacterium]|nr:hypothetical protein [Planctomycetota bacterium]